MFAARLKLTLINTLLASPLCPRPARVLGMRALGVDIKTVRLSPRCFFGGTNVTIGAGTFVNYEVFFDNQARISLGANCAIGPRVQLITSVHEQGPAAQRAGAVVGQPVTVEDGCWLGAGAIVLPSVTIGPGCIIAAGAVVTADCDPNGVYAGVPARRIRDLES